MLGMKTQEEKVDDGLRALRDVADEIGERDLAMKIDEIIYRGSMQKKCVNMVYLSQILPLLMLSKKIKEIIHDLEEE
jgi:hypothetical protein